VDLQSVMKQLKAWEHPKMRAVNAKHGAGDNQFGVNLGKLRGLAGRIKRDHTLALELWRSGNIDAMNLATLIMDPKQLTQPEVEKLAKDLSYYTTTDWFVKNVIRTLPFKGELCRKWAASKDEYIGRAGWTLMAGQLDDNDPEALLGVIEKMTKQRKESIAQFEAGGRADLVAKEKAELDLLASYLPTPLSDAELDALIDQAITVTGASSIKDMGKVVAQIKTAAAGRADMGRVSALVKARLSG
jgi:uncharacterized protein YqeY